MLSGSPIVLTQSYRVEMNSFLADGGDGFSVFRQCTDQLGGEVDIDAVVRYFMATARSRLRPTTGSCGSAKTAVRERGRATGPSLVDRT